MSDPVQADAGALAALRLLGELAKAAKGTDEKARWYATVTRTECWSAMAYQGLCSDARVTREALANACTPEVILALVQDAERYREALERIAFMGTDVASGMDAETSYHLTANDCIRTAARAVGCSARAAKAEEASHA